MVRVSLPELYLIASCCLFLLLLFVFLIGGWGEEGVGLFTFIHCKYTQIILNMVTLYQIRLQRICGNIKSVYNMLTTFFKITGLNSVKTARKD